MSVIPFSEVSGGLQAANCKSLLERANETITGLEEQRDLMQREVEEAQLAADRAREAAARAPLPAVKRPAIAQDLCPAAPSALLCSALLCSFASLRSCACAAAAAAACCSASLLPRYPTATSRQLGSSLLDPCRLTHAVGAFQAASSSGTNDALAALLAQMTAAQSAAPQQQPVYAWGPPPGYPPQQPPAGVMPPPPHQQPYAQPAISQPFQQPAPAPAPQPPPLPSAATAAAMEAEAAGAARAEQLREMQQQQQVMHRPTLNAVSSVGWWSDHFQ